jgi:hypothetical protein
LLEELKIKPKNKNVYLEDAKTLKLEEDGKW